MFYHGFYKEQVSWIGEVVAEVIRFANGKFPLYAGFFLSVFKSNNELEQAIKRASINRAWAFLFLAM